MNWFTAVYALLFLLLFIVLEVLKRGLGLRAEVTRKIVHLFSGILVASMPWFISQTAIIFLSVSFFLLLLFSKRLRIFRSIHEVERKTLGEFAFALGAGLAASILLPEKAMAFSFGFIILGFSDTAAEFVGSFKPIRRFNLFGATKSLGGSLAFFAISALVSIMWAGLFGLEIALIRLTIVLVLLSLLEFFQPYGLDDLSLPLITGLLYPF